MGPVIWFINKVLKELLTSFYQFAKSLEAQGGDEPIRKFAAVLFECEN